MKLTVFRSSDGLDFDTKSECIMHEQSLHLSYLGEATKEIIEREMNDHSSRISLALEWAGSKIGTARRASGVRKRAIKVHKKHAA